LKNLLQGGEGGQKSIFFLLDVTTSKMLKLATFHFCEDIIGNKMIIYLFDNAKM